MYTPHDEACLQMICDLKWQLEHLPNLPGVYLMKNRQGTVLYIGKAIRLTDRVRSYFQKTDHAPKTRSMVSQIASIETMVVSSELEALLLENNLIKKYRPKYNVLLRDDKNYPLLRLPIKDDYPRLEIVRRVLKDGALYFGPYIPSDGLYEMLRLLRKIFPLPNCTIEINGHADRPCIEYEIKRCLAPCTGFQSKEEYKKMIAQVILFLEGKDNDLVQHLQKEMQEKSDLCQFESAATIRDQIAKIKRALERQRITTVNRDDQDAISFFRKDASCTIVILFVRGGMVLGQKDFFFADVAEISDETMVATFLQQFYDGDKIIPKKVILPLVLQDQSLLQQWLSERGGNAISVLSPSRGASAQLIDLAYENARSAFASRHTMQCARESARKSDSESDSESVLSKLQTLLHLSRLPNRIEGYDISNIMGTSAVGSMVVFEGGVSKKSDYRHFKIKTIEGANDFAMMTEILTRRITGSQAQNATKPDLILIDGGKGQISAVRKVLEDTGCGSIDLIGLAKAKNGNPERVFLPDLAEPIILPVGNSATHLLMQVRDEAHRFAITYHRKIRSQKMLRSPLEEIAGIGKKRRLALLVHFGSLAKIKEASLDEIEMAQALPKKVAQQLFDTLHRNPFDNRMVK
jgi:excinuclease ABC subunit C